MNTNAINPKRPSGVLNTNGITSIQDLATFFVEALINSDTRYPLIVAARILRDNGLDCGHEELRRRLQDLGITKPDGRATEMAELAGIAVTDEHSSKLPALLTGRGLYIVVCLLLFKGKEEEQ